VILHHSNYRQERNLSIDVHARQFTNRKVKTMKKIKISLVVLFVVLALLTTSVAVAKPDPQRNFVAPLSGAEEVPARDTAARGLAKFQVSKDGTELQYILTVAKIRNVFAAHIHCGAAGVNGPVGVTLFMGAPAGGLFSGVLAQATVTAPDPGNGCAWATLDDVVSAMRSGDTYVNVHTNDGVAPGNTGPGDFQSGEIRGQVR